MGSIYEARWCKAKELTRELIERQEQVLKKFDGNICIAYRDETFPDGVEFIIDEEQGEINFSVVGGYYGLFNKDPDWDDGAHWTIEEIEKKFAEFQIYVPYKKWLELTK